MFANADKATIQKSRKQDFKTAKLYLDGDREGVKLIGNFCTRMGFMQEKVIFHIYPFGNEIRL